MVERVLSTLAGLAVPVLGLAVQASRRSRLQRRIEDHLRLADVVRSHDPDGARGLEQLAREGLGKLILRDERWLRRKIDPTAVAALILLASPGVAGFILSLDWDSGWRWPAMVASVVWTAVWVSVGASQLHTEATEDQPPHNEARSGS